MDSSFLLLYNYDSKLRFLKTSKKFTQNRSIVKTTKLKIMKLFTKEIEEKAQAQFPKGNDLESQVAVAKFFNPTGAGTWYLMNQDPEDTDYCWGICHIFEWEIGSFSKSELENFKSRMGLGIERDLHFTEVNAKDLWDSLVRI